MPASGREDSVRESIRAAARRIAADAPPLTPAQRDLLARIWVKPTDKAATA
ncbi:hypothetical protein [Williamsia deligens]|uniref:Uncharacterized protein n=1 Tax=Williamsia deligens TaxID=321325 RepID=A0ABW3GD24_9NOCA|nr:hypothetical protein [Williamsia deligens]MCP2195684.1 hypothetical protein [Williamsia deligens]